jgi:signal peptidase I
VAEEIKSTTQEREQRRMALERLKARGIDPYPHHFAPTHNASGAAALADVPSTVTVAGRIGTIRELGRIAFTHLNDDSGAVQLMLRKDLIGDGGWAMLRDLHAGDIVVFARPPAENCGGPPVPDLVKRVVGLPGQRISSRGNTVLINGKPLAEPWLPRPDPLVKPITPITIPRNDYYVMGDNRAQSCDSRYWGPVPRSLIVGKVVAIFWPLSRLHWF